MRAHGGNLVALVVALALTALFAIPVSGAEGPPLAAREVVQAPTIAGEIARLVAAGPRLSGSEKKNFDAIAGFYRQRQFAPVLIGDEGWSRTAQRLMKRLSLAQNDGLEPADYIDKAFTTIGPETVASVKGEGEIALMRALLRYAGHALGGRVDLAKLRPNVFAKRPELDQPAFLALIADSPDAVAVLEAQNPPHPAFLALRRMLAGLLEQKEARNRAAIADIVINMERWRWLPRQLGSSFVMVSVPEYLVRYVDTGKVAYQGRVIVGQQTTPTPLFSGEMQYIVVNPSWTVPPGILKNEILPLYRRDPAAVARRGLEVVRNRGGGVSFRQAPGERNALGRVKFMFPNDYSIYLHDTPTRHLFARDERALSHGCVRVDQPLKFADAVFAREEGLNSKRIEGLYGRSERHVRLKRRIPVHLTYFTVSSAGDGELARHADVYGLDVKMKQIMGL